MAIHFEELWNTHHMWGQNVWIKKKHEVEQNIIVNQSYVENIYFTYAYTSLDALTPQQLPIIEEKFASFSSQPAIFVNETQRKNHMPEFLIRHGYQYAFNDSWMFYNPSMPIELSEGIKIEDIDSNTFDDFSSILSVVFSSFPANPQYLEICRKSLTEKPDNGMNDFASTFFVIYDNGVPASGAGMFYSLEQNFAYLHNAGTLEAYRGKGYQSALIKYRVHLAQSLGINRIYSSVSQGSVSWANMIRCGFDEGQNLLLFTKKPAAVVA